MKDVLKNASNYIFENGTSLQKACLDCILGHYGNEIITKELKRYQNEDGGFSNGLEISSAGRWRVATSVWNI